MTHSLVDGFKDYSRRLAETLAAADWSAIEELALALDACRHEGRQVFLCGNGGSAGNELHITNDLIYGAAKGGGKGLRAHSLSANISMLTCLANDVGYEQVFAWQLQTLAQKGDLLIALSGSGNSPNILAALAQARRMELRSYAILGYSGGKAKDMADRTIHFAVEDMQVSEDLQLVVGHMIMRHLCKSTAEQP